MRFIGIILLLTFFFQLGFQKVVDPRESAGIIATKSHLGYVMRLAGLPPLSRPDTELLERAVGVSLVALSLMCLLGIARRAAAYLLFLELAIITVLVHVDVKNVQKTPKEEWINVIKNVAIGGGLLILASLRGERKIKVE